MGFKIKDLLRIIKEAEQRERSLDRLGDKISGYIDERGHLIYDPDRCKQEFLNAKEEYDNWINTELTVEFSEDKECKADDATHATNMYIMERLKEYLDKNSTIRFGQALVNLDIVSYRRVNGELDSRGGKFHVLDPFYDKPDHTLEKMKRRLEHEKNN